MGRFVVNNYRQKQRTLLSPERHEAENFLFLDAQCDIPDGAAYVWRFGGRRFPNNLIQRCPEGIKEITAISIIADAEGGTRHHVQEWPVRHVVSGFPRPTPNTSGKSREGSPATVDRDFCERMAPGRRAARSTQRRLGPK